MPDHQYPLGGFAVLVVEGNADTLETAACLIGDVPGCTVFKALSGDEALNVHHGCVDLVFADVVMPHMDGLALARLIRQRSPALPVVLTTGLPTVLNAARDCGAIALMKRFRSCRRDESRNQPIDARSAGRHAPNEAEAR